LLQIGDLFDLLDKKSPAVARLDSLNGQVERPYAVNGLSGRIFTRG
jgi:hypothetical protein